MLPLEQYSQEGYDVYHILFASCGDILNDFPSSIGRDSAEFAMITFGLNETVINNVCGQVQSLIARGLRACVHYSPLVSHASQLLQMKETGIQGSIIP